MGDVTKIEWADRTFNPWIGCQKVGPGCDNCYAETMDNRFGGGHWGPGALRRRTAPANWRKPLKWEREQAALWAEYHSLVTHCSSEDPRPDRPEPRPCFVFCASLADVFDNAVPTEWRRDLFDLIRRTPNLTWLLLTKRPGNIVKLFKAFAEDDLGPYADEMGIRSVWPRNAAIGCTVVNQDEADRDIPVLLEAKAALNPAFAFLSMEPLLGPVDLRNVSTMRYPGAEYLDALTGETRGMLGEPGRMKLPAVDWAIVGGESGSQARPMDLDWPRDLFRQTDGTEAVFNFKQVGGRTSDKGGHELDGQTYFGRPSV